MFIFNWSNPGGEILKILYGMFVQLDVWIYSLAGACFDLIKNIYEFDFFSGGNLIGQVKNRIYMALGIVMVFRVILAGVQFIVNPDLFDDKEKGLVGILKNALITVILIAAVPAVFRLALNVQGSIVEAIPNIIFGSGKTEVSYTVIKRDSNNSQLESEQLQTTVSQNNITTGNDIAFSVLQGFISPAKYTKNDKIPNGKKVGDQKDDKASVGINDSQNSYQIHDIETFRQYATTNMEEGLENASYSYIVIISTLGGGFLVYILASMSFDVAIRTIKLGIIQMLSPIPIASYMFKKDNFNKFVKMSFKVYADLFIRMVVIYVIILVVQILVNSGILNLGRSTDNIFDFLRNIILIFGLLMFAKSAPKFLTELLGLPDVTSGEMAAMFKPAWQRAGGAAAQAFNPLRTATAAAINSWQNSENLRGSRGKNLRRMFRAAGAGVRGSLQGAFDSYQGVVAGDDFAKMKQRMQNRDTKNFKKAFKSNFYRTMSVKDANAAKRAAVGANIAGFFGQTTVNSEGYKKAANLLSSFRSEAFTGRAKGEVDKAPTLFNDLVTSGIDLRLQTKDGERGINTTFSATDASGNSYNNVDYGALHTLHTKIQAGTAKASDFSAVSYTDSSGVVHNFSAADAAKISDVHERIGKKAYSEYVNIAVAASKRLKSDPTLSEADRERLTGLADMEVLQRVQRTREAIGALNIPSKDKAELFRRLENDTGNFLAGSNKDVQDYLTKAAQLEKMEQAQNGGK